MMCAPPNHIQPQELAATQLRNSRLSEMLHAAEAARTAAEAHARKLEAKFERSGRGVALLKAARLSCELEAVQAELRGMHAQLAAKVSCRKCGGCIWQWSATACMLVASLRVCCMVSCCGSLHSPA